MEEKTQTGLIMTLNEAADILGIERSIGNLDRIKRVANDFYRAGMIRAGDIAQNHEDRAFCRTGIKEEIVKAAQTETI